MATTKPNQITESGADAPATPPAAVTAAVAATAATVPTPDNTPLPGGGRYRWDIAAPGWVDLDAPAPDAAAAA